MPTMLTQRIRFVRKHAANSMICTLTASEGGSFHYGNLYSTCDCDTQAQYLQKGRMRVWNSLTVPLLAGVPSENILQLGYFDSTLTAMRQNPEKEIKSTKIDTTDVYIFRRANTSPLAKHLKPGSTWNSLVDNLGYLIERSSRILSCRRPPILMRIPTTNILRWPPSKPCAKSITAAAICFCTPYII